MTRHELVGGIELLDVADLGRGERDRARTASQRFGRNRPLMVLRSSYQRPPASSENAEVTSR